MSTAKPAKSASPAKKASAAIAVKRTLRAARPKFSRHAHYRKASLDDNWRKPRGLHNKQKDNKKNRLPKPSDGWRTPQEVRGLHISGMEIVNVANVKQLANIDTKTQAVVIASVGAKRQIELLQACVKQNIKVLNHNPEKRIEALLKKDSDKKASVEANRKTKEAAEKQKQAKTKKPVEDKLTEEEKKKQQDKIKEEILTDKSQ